MQLKICQWKILAIMSRLKTLLDEIIFGEWDVYVVRKPWIINNPLIALLKARILTLRGQSWIVQLLQNLRMCIQMVDYSWNAPGSSIMVERKAFEEYLSSSFVYTKEEWERSYSSV